MNRKQRLRVSAAVALMVMAFGCTPTTAQKSNTNNSENLIKKENKKMKVKELNAEEFKKLVFDYANHPNEWVFEGNRPAVIDFYATWCGPCKATAPAVEAIAGQYDGKIDVYKIDVDKQEELAALFGVQSMPTILFVPMKGQPTKNVGAMTQQMLDQAVKELLL